MTNSTKRVGLIFILLLGLLTMAPAPPAPTPPVSLAAYPWLFLRQGRPLAPDETAVELMFVGDVMLGRGVAEDSRSGQQPLALMESWLGSADLAVGNLEGPITHQALHGNSDSALQNTGQPYILLMPPSAAPDLAEAGFDILSLANNHALDAGPAGLADTFDHLEAAGIKPVGITSPIGAGSQPLIRQVKGLRLAFLAFNAIPYPARPNSDQSTPGWGIVDWDPAKVAAAVTAASQQADVVVVLVHWGHEYQISPSPTQRQDADLLLQAGADLVLGHHPHVVQPVAISAPGSLRSRSGLVAYSLGNLVFDQMQEETRKGLVLRILVDRQGLRAAQALPLWAGLHPRPMSAVDAAPLMDRVVGDGVRVAYACGGQNGPLCHQVEASQIAAGDGKFDTGQIDLTGDGQPEGVRLDGEQMVVYAPLTLPRNSSPTLAAGPEPVELWRSPPQWQVVDAAVGDPNHDGRGELMLAFWRQDQHGKPGSHPFIIGYREGIYRTLWGGSAAAHPLQEIELGDVDGDGLQELLVLESLPDGDTISLWRWHGWGFTLDWRSPPGCYSNLQLLPGQAGSAPLISVLVRDQCLSP